MRRCEVLTDGQHWRETAFAALAVGHVFRLFEADGRRVVDDDGCWRWRVVARLADDADGRHQVETVAVPESDVERAARDGVVWWPDGLRSSRSGRLRA